MKSNITMWSILATWNLRPLLQSMFWLTPVWCRKSLLCILTRVCSTLGACAICSVMGVLPSSVTALFDNPSCILNRLFPFLLRISVCSWGSDDVGWLYALHVWADDDAVVIALCFKLDLPPGSDLQRLYRGSEVVWSWRSSTSSVKSKTTSCSIRLFPSVSWTTVTASTFMVTKPSMVTDVTLQRRAFTRPFMTGTEAIAAIR